MKKLLLMILAVCMMQMASNAQTIIPNGTKTAVVKNMIELVEEFAPRVHTYSGEVYNMSNIEEWYLPQVRKVQKTGTTDIWKFPGVITHTKLVEENVHIFNVNIGNRECSKNMLMAEELWDGSDEATKETNIGNKVNQDWIGLDYKTNGVKVGQLSNAKCYVNIVPSTYQHYPLNEHDIDIQYHYFYPFNGGVGSHEGDWEEVDIKLTIRKVRGGISARLKAVGLSAHGDMKWYNPSKIEFVENDLGIKNTPVVFAAGDSHAFYENEGEYAANVPYVAAHLSGILDRTDYGTPFETRNNYEIIGINYRIREHNTYHLLGKPKHRWVYYNGKWGGTTSWGQSWGAGNGPGPCKDLNAWKGKNQNEDLAYQPDAYNGIIPSSQITGSSEIIGSYTVCTSYSNYTMRLAPSVELVRFLPPTSPLVNYTISNNSLSIRGSSQQAKGMAEISAIIKTNYGLFSIEDKVTRNVFVRGSIYSVATGITGPSNMVVNTNAYFTAPIVQGDVSNQWIIPSDWSILDGQGGRIARLLAGSSTGSKKVTYRSVDICGTTDEIRYVNVTSTSGGGGGPAVYRIGNGEVLVAEKESLAEDLNSKNTASALEDSELNDLNLVESIIYPNPANNLITILFPETDSYDGFKVELISLNGQTMLFQEVTSSKVDVDVSKFENGVYFVRISNNKNSMMKKLMIQN